MTCGAPPLITIPKPSKSLSEGIGARPNSIINFFRATLSEGRYVRHSWDAKVYHEFGFQDSVLLMDLKKINHPSSDSSSAWLFVSFIKPPYKSFACWALRSGLEAPPHNPHPWVSSTGIPWLQKISSAPTSSSKTSRARNFMTARTVCCQPDEQLL